MIDYSKRYEETPNAHKGIWEWVGEFLVAFAIFPMAWIFAYVLSVILKG